MFVMWLLWPRSAVPSPAGNAASSPEADERAPLIERQAKRNGWFDWVDLNTVDLFADEWQEAEGVEEELPNGWKARAKRVYEWVA
jgi:hypothetical protein